MKDEFFAIYYQQTNDIPNPLAHIASEHPKQHKPSLTQGLELDWVCVVWDAHLRYAPEDWEYRSFVGNKWQKIHLSHRQMYLKNAYRVLLTRARQGMVIVVPEGEVDDPTRDPAFYDPIYDYLSSLGIQEM